MRAALVGFGAVGSRVARLLTSSPEVESLTVVHRDPRRVQRAVDELGAKVQLRRATPGPLPRVDVTVIAVPTGTQRTALDAIAQGSHVVSVNDDPSEVKALLRTDTEARRRGRTVVAGAAFAPGLSCVVAGYLALRFDRIDEIHVASVGTGGPACARRRHAALTALAVDWDDREWRRRPGGSGRELVWFPEPVGGADCYRASLADSLLLVPRFPDARRIASRIEATRRDRLTSWMPMLRAPHPEGLIGAARVELRGWRAGRADTAIMGTAVRPALAAGAVAAQAARWVVGGRLSRTGVGGLAELVDKPAEFLRELADVGIGMSEFEGLGADAPAEP